MKNFYFLIIMLFVTLPAFSQVPKLITPDTAVEMAIRNNLNLESARLGLDIRRRRADMAWNNFLPGATVTGTLFRENAATVVQMPFPVTIPQWGMTGAFTATLDFSFALIEGMRAARLDYQAGRVSFERAKLQMEQGVRKMYNNILLLKANVDLLHESFANAERQAAIAEANFRAGMVPRLTWLQAQVAVENMKPTVNNLQNNLNVLKGNFALLLGLPFYTQFEFEPLDFFQSEIPMDLNELISRAVSQKPDIIELQANISAMQSQLRAINLQLFTPFLRLGWTLSYMFNPILDPFQDSLFTADNWNRGGNLSITLGMNFNSLFSFTREGQQRQDLKTSLQIQNLRLAQTIREAELEVFTTLASLENILATIDAQRAAVDLAEESFRLTEEAYRAGLQELQAVQGAALALDQARLQLLTQQFNFLNDLIDLEYAIGVPFGTLSSIGSLNGDQTLNNTGSIQ